MEDRTLWEDVLAEVERKLGSKGGRGLVDGYLAGASLVDVDCEEAVIAVANEFTRRRIEGKIAEAVAAAFESLLGARPAVRIVVDPAAAPESKRKPERAPSEKAEKAPEKPAEKPAPPKEAPRAPAMSGSVNVGAPRPAERMGRTSGRLSRQDLAAAAGAGAKEIADPAGVIGRFGADLSLESFVIGPGSKLAYRAAERACDHPGGEASPLVISGAEGLGKTHLLAAIARRMTESRPKEKVLFATAEEFLNQFLASIKRNAPGAFRDRYRTADVVIIDDIHLLRGKEKTQEELTHTLDELKHAEKQVVVSSETPPNRIEGLSQRLSTRLMSGMVVTIDPPDAETRRRLVEHHAKRLRASLTHDVAELLARGLHGNVRDIVGAVQRLQAHAAIGERIDVARARRLLADLVGRRPAIPIEELILQVVAERHGVTGEELKTGRRQTVARARQVAMFLLRRLSPLSLAEIGRFFGKEPSTVTYAESAIRQAIVADDDLNRVVEECSRLVGERR